MARKMQLTNMSNTLVFLQESYGVFYSMTLENRAIQLEFNEQMSRGLGPPLRDLYITLAMYDEMIESFREYDSLFRTTVKNKIITEQDIRQREELEEKIVPNPQIVKVMAEIGADEEQLQKGLLQWIPENCQDKFSRQLAVIWKQAKKEKDPENKIQAIVPSIIQVYSKLGLAKTVENFHALFSIVECLLFFFEK